MISGKLVNKDIKAQGKPALMALEKEDRTGGGIRIVMEPGYNR